MATEFIMAPGTIQGNTYGIDIYMQINYGYFLTVRRLGNRAGWVSGLGIYMTLQIIFKSLFKENILPVYFKLKNHIHTNFNEQHGI